MSVSLGIDVGGTFTDLVALDHQSGHGTIWKESTTPDDPARGVVDGIRRLLAEHRIAPADISRVVHATTLFTNALIERKGAPTGLLTTAGFADVLEIGRERKYELYDVAIEMPRPLVPRPWRREAMERLAPDGGVEIRLDIDAALREVESLVGQGVRSLAIVFLHAYANPAHEQQAAAAIAQRFPRLSLSLSSAIAPEIREYPRTSTTVANAYVQPLAASYLDRLEAALTDLGIGGQLLLMLSSGGLAPIAEARRTPVQLLESGPAAGALAAAVFGRSAGLDRVLAFDMGGTTAKLAIVEAGEPLVAWGFEAARQKRFLRGSGLPIQIATVELIEIGAGGGSIARRGALGTLQVGPESAGAVPGPACYGRGGEDVTVTDADLAVGCLDPHYFLGGAMRIDTAAASSSLSRLAAEIGLPAQRVAAGIRALVDETMTGAARVAIAERGAAPPDYALLATGGAGPLHAWEVARRLGVQRILCPPGAGAGSALGMLMAPARVDRAASVNALLDRADWQAVDATFARPDRGGGGGDPGRGWRYGEVADATDGGPALCRAGFRGDRHIAGRAVGGGRAGGVRSAVSRAVQPHRAGCGGATGHTASVADRADPGGAVQRDAASPDGAGAAGEGPANGWLRRGRHHDRCVRPLCAAAGYAVRRPGGDRGKRKHFRYRSGGPCTGAGRWRDPGGASGMTAPFDPIELELLWRRLISIVDEAAAALVRTSFSTLVRDSYDFSCIVTDAAGQSLVQATESIPSFIGTLPATVKHFLRCFPPDRLAEGDVLITNDIWMGTGHLNDITVAKPIFVAGRLVAFSASTAHAPDIGGKIRSPEPREVFEEGLQIPPMKLVRAGAVDETLLTILRQNVRTPEQTVGDLWAQLVALDTMEARLLALMQGVGLRDLTALAGAIHGRCEHAMRSAISALPDGTYRSELQTDGLMDTPITIRMALTIAGDTIEVDYAGTDPQVDRAINCALCYTYAMTMYGVKLCTSPTLPNNEGAWRPVRLLAPPGCIVNPQFPASGGSRMLIGHYLPMLVLGCLGQVVPERVIAACGSPMWGMNQAGVHAGNKPYANMFFFNGGMGAGQGRDGQSCLSWPSNVASTSIEISEQIAPLRFHYKRLRPDSGGAGRRRGGLGQEILIESRSETPIAVSFLAERTVIPAFGLAGGEPGATGMLWVNGAAVDPKRQYVLRHGDTVLLATPGGGGHGDKRRRDAVLLADDAKAGYTTVRTQGDE